ncbi:MAG TPA: lamin tail domain-containing protein [Bacteroidota bacterium]|nr:lamin tail domain-containing protein [Bacteroidota bacterium]
MIRKALYSAVLFSLLFPLSLRSQNMSFPYVEQFDTVSAPGLPTGWISTTNKSASGDFVISSSTPYSSPNDVVTTDAKVAQSLLSPQIDFTRMIVGSLEYRERRTSSHNSGLIVEAVLDNDTSSAIVLGDTLKNPGSTSYVLRSFTLPQSLNGRPNVRFRWRVVGNGTGSTGTLRIDDVEITVQKQRDLAITALQLQPATVRSGQTVTVFVGVSNRALGGTFSFSVQLFDDKDVDLPGASAKKVDELDIVRIFAAAESTTFTLNYPNVAPGSHRLIVQLNFAGDEDTTNNTAAKTILVGYSPRSVLINEIMFAPTAGPEWVEYINNSSDSIPLAQWKMGDNSGTRATLTSQSIQIPPKQFFIVAKDTSIFSAFPSIICPVVAASFPALNNDGDAVVVEDPAGFTIDSVAYSSAWGGTGGRSLERIDTADASNSPSNWGSSRSTYGATPGRINSLTKKEYDVSVSGISLSNPQLDIGQAFQVTATIKNVGREPLSAISAQFFLDENNDSIPQSDELVGQNTINQLMPADSQAVLQTLKLTSQGKHRIIAVAGVERDDDSSNNSVAISFETGIASHSMIINEIMYAPPGNMPEWIELYNADTIAVDLAGWKVSDSNIKSRASVTGRQTKVGPGSYCVVSSDSTLGNFYSVTVPLLVSSFPALNNSTADAVVLYDDRGLTIDSVWYKPSWGGSNGRSLERVDYLASSVDSSNWRNSPPTPGAENSVAKKNFDLEVASFDGVLNQHGLYLSATVHNAGRKPATAFRVQFFLDRNRDHTGSPEELLYSVDEPMLASGDSLTVEYEWRSEVEGAIPFVCVVDFPEDERPSNNIKNGLFSNSFMPQSVIINEIMYDPLPGRSEFVELFNRSGDTLDLQGWKMMDTPTSSGNRTVTRIADTSFLLRPGEFLVIGADSTLLIQFPNLSSLPDGKVIIAGSDLSLNNSGDDIILVDLTGTKIDSVRYSPSWHNPGLHISTSGKSLERINPSLGSNDRQNWSTSIASQGGTPGEQNSIYTNVIPSTAQLRLSPNPFSPDGDGVEDFLSVAYALPMTVSMIRVRCFDVQGRLVRTLANNEPAAATGTILWDGLDDAQRRVRIGMYIILFEALDQNGGVLRTMKDVAVVARKL